jgi:hypothetical protein
MPVVIDGELDVPQKHRVPNVRTPIGCVKKQSLAMVLHHWYPMSLMFIG